MGEIIAGSHRRDRRTRLLLVTRSTEQRTLKQIWFGDPQHDQSPQAMARTELKNGAPLLARAAVRECLLSRRCMGVSATGVQTTPHGPLADMTCPGLRPRRDCL